MPHHVLAVVLAVRISRSRPLAWRRVPGHQQVLLTPMQQVRSQPLLRRMSFSYDYISRDSTPHLVP